MKEQITVGELKKLGKPTEQERNEIIDRMVSIAADRTEEDFTEEEREFQRSLAKALFLMFPQGAPKEFWDEFLDRNEFTTVPQGEQK